MNNRRFEGKVAIVTGSGRGIGKEIASGFAGEGAKVVICDVNEETCRETAAELCAKGAEAIAVKVDVTKAEEVQALVGKTIEAFGRIDILVNNAGVVRDFKITEMSEADWDLVLDVCLKGDFLCCKAVVPHMIEQKYGRIVNLSSRAYLGNPGQANYSAAKAGVVGLTRALSKELGKHGITVNAVAPGLVNTDMVKHHPKFEKICELQIKQTPIPRIGEVEDVKGAILFFASDDASYITGDILHVTGGRKG